MNWRIKLEGNHIKIFFCFPLFITGWFFGQICPSDITITTNRYKANLTQSKTYITINSSTDTGKVIKLDANPNEGYVLMNAGFIAMPSSTGAFIAQLEYECETIELQKTNALTSLHNNLDIEFSIYPNPTNGIVNISFQKKNKVDLLFLIYDSSGKLVLKNGIQGALQNYSIDITNLVSGSYFYKIGKENNMKTGVILKK